MKISVGSAFPGLLVGLLCFQSVWGELSWEHHRADQPASDVSPRTEFTNGLGNVERLVVGGHVAEKNSPSSPERRRAIYDDSRQGRVEAGQDELTPRTTPHLHDSAGQVEGSGAKSDFPCPDSAAIFPCVCSYDADYNIDLNCTFVESEEQLARVFQQEFPVKELSGFYMSQNSAIKVLSNILNGISFESVDLCCGSFALETISEYFLLASKDSLIYLRIRNSQLTSDHFPFAVLSEMGMLQQIHIITSNITWIPKILAPKISTMYFMDGQTEIIKSGTFPVHAQSQAINMQYNDINTVEPGSFFWADENSNLSNEKFDINLQGNRIESLEAETFLFRDGRMEVWLGSNTRLSSIAPGTFVMPPTTDSLTVTISLANNQLETIDEDVFGELMPYLEYLQLEGNPLLCGCDIAWIVTNAYYMLLIDYDATCADGINLHDLDPALFDGLCPGAGLDISQ